MFVINPDKYSLPCYRIGPFKTIDLSKNHNFPNSEKIDGYFQSRFLNKQFIYTINGRNAINTALKYYDLKENDVVTIFTTSGNFYISGCVTNEIEKFCKWSRKVETKTKLIFVNHEFGFPFPDLYKLKELNLPIIEDCAGSFFSEDKNKNIGEIGDFVIFSFPKMFPLQVGGLLVSNLVGEFITTDSISDADTSYIKNVLSSYIDYRDIIIAKRIENFKYLSERFKSLELEERFSLEIGTVPAVFMFRTDNLELNLDDMKRFFYSHGIQCSVFYGEEAFFIPVHQALNTDDMDYFYEVMRAFIKQLGK